MTAVDRLGFHVRLKTQEGMRGARIRFPTRSAQPGGDAKSPGGNGAAGPRTNEVNLLLGSAALPACE